MFFLSLALYGDRIICCYLDPYGDLIAPFSPPSADAKDDETLDEQIKKYKELIQSLEEAQENKDESENDMEMEISWEPGVLFWFGTLEPASFAKL